MSEEEEAPKGKSTADLFGDDSDGSSDDEEEEEAGAAPKGVPMKGDMTLVEGRLFWTGTWADSEEDFAAGKGKKFKYGGPTGDEGALRAPPAGTWNGYFFNPGEEGDAKVKEKGLKLTFASDGKVSGGGENEFGEFSLKGAYDAAAKTMTLRKAYLYQGEDDDEDDDEIDSDAAEEDYGDELAALNDEAEIPVEELMKRYKAMEEAAMAEEAGGEPAKKKARAD